MKNKQSENDEFRSGELHYKDVIYTGTNTTDYIWCEYFSRFHTVTELEYRIKAWYAKETQYSPIQLFEKLDKITNTGWHNTPQKCRDDFDSITGIKLLDVIKEDTIGLLPPEMETKIDFERSDVQMTAKSSLNQNS